jgi:hypothetical protein
VGEAELWLVMRASFWEAGSKRRRMYLVARVKEFRPTW